MAETNTAPGTYTLAGDTAATAFISKWQGVTASELSTSQSFLIDLCHLLGVDTPHPTAELDYMFERPITFSHGDGSSSAGRIDLYRRGAFVLESVLHAYGWGDLLPVLRIAHGNDTPAEGQIREDAKRAFDEAILERLVALNAERAVFEARGEIHWLRPEFQNPEAYREPEQRGLDATNDRDEPATPAAVATKPVPWPRTPSTRSAPSPTSSPLAPSHSQSIRSPRSSPRDGRGKSGCQSCWRCSWRWVGPMSRKGR